MSIINPTMPTIGAPRGSEEIDVRSALVALLADYNGNIDLSNILTPLLYLAAGADRKVNLGTFVTAAFDSTANMSRVTGSFAHGLGSSPTVVLGTCGSIADSAHGGVENAVTFSPVSWDATNVNYVCTLGGGTANNSTDVYWVAIA